MFRQFHFYFNYTNICMKEEYYFNENWLRCLGDYCTECDGSRKLGKTISDEIIELNGMFDEYNSEDNSTKRVGFRITRIILLGIRLDEEANNCHGVERIISTPDSKVTVMVVPTNEELAIARETVEIVSK